MESAEGNEERESESVYAAYVSMWRQKENARVRTIWCTLVQQPLSFVSLLPPLPPLPFARASPRSLAPLPFARASPRSVAPQPVRSCVFRPSLSFLP